MIAIVRVALRRPYTFVVLALVILIVGPLAAAAHARRHLSGNPHPRHRGRSGNTSDCRRNRWPAAYARSYQRALTTTVNDIEHIEANSYNGTRHHQSILPAGRRHSHGQCASHGGVADGTQTNAAGHDASADPELQRLDRADHPARAFRDQGCPNRRLADIGLNTMRTPSLVTVPGAAIPLPYGGKLRQVQIDLDSAAMQARGLSGQDVANALAAQNLITPVGTQKIGSFEYAIQLNNAPSVIAELGDLPIKTVNGAIVYIRDVAHVRDGNPPQTNIVHVEGNRSVLMQVLKNGCGIDAGDHRRHQGESAGGQRRSCRSNLKIALLGDQSIFIKAAVERRHPRRRHRGRADQRDDFDLSRQLAIDAHHRDVHPLVGARFDRDAFGARRDTEHHDPGRPRARRRHSRRRRHGDDREHQLASRAGQRGRDRHHGRRGADRHAGVRLAAVHLHRLRADVFSARRVALPVCADGRSRDVGDGCSFILSRTLVPTMANYLLRRHAPHTDMHGLDGPLPPSRNPLVRLQRGFERGFERVRAGLSRTLGDGAAPPRGIRERAFLASCIGSFALTPYLGRDFFPTVDAGQILHACAHARRHARRGKRAAIRRNSEGDPPDHSARRARDDGRQYRLSGQAAST